MERRMSVEEICKRLRPVLGRKIDLLYFNYSMASDMESKRQIEQALAALYYKHINKTFLSDKVLLEPPKKEKVSGEYPLAKVIYSDDLLHDFCLRESDWNRHVCITGMSGSGKTNFAFKILNNFIDKQKPFLIFDWKKSFRPLMVKDKSLMCFTIGNEKVNNLFKININRPPRGVSPKEWLKILAELITESFAASYGVHKLLCEVLDKTFKDFGVYEGSGNYPTWFQIKDRLEAKADSMQGKKTRESEWMVSALRIAHSLTFGDFAKVINFKEKPLINLDDLFEKRAIFELNSLGNIEKKFFCEFVLTYIYKHRKVNQDGYDHSFKYAILVDEAHNIFLKKPPLFISESVTDMIYRELREYGVSLICLDQHISKLSETVVGNSATSVAFQQMLPYDIETVSSLMMLRDNKKYFTMLPVGCAIVRLAERYYEPFVIKTLLDENKNKAVSDLDIRQRLNVQLNGFARSRKYSEGVNVQKLRKEFADIEDRDYQIGIRSDGARDEFEDALQKIISYKDNKKISKSCSLNKQQKQFLDFISQYPQYGTTQVYKALNLSARKGNKIKKELEDFGLIEVEEKRSICGWKKVLKPSAAASGNLMESPHSVEITA
ncbi:MAG: DUF87 domain-containing protein [Nanoarchaeota archaeon]|nr:DUF87 domain-containing protein [Nanoarchaeota archaeon]